MKKESRNKLIWVTLFAVAMGFLEAIVVVYLRKLFYPDGFNFPLKGFIEPAILNIEWIREFATVVMLLAIGFIAGRKAYEKMAYFIYAFAIWDIFYYVFLKLALDWPASLITWDVLFLIPWPWAGQVIAPVICSLIMIVMAIFVINFEDAGKKVRVSAGEWAFFIVGMILTLYTWLYDYGKLIIGGGFAKDFFTLANNPEFYFQITNYVPVYYNWPVFILGVIIAAIGVVLFYIRMRKRRK